MRPTTHDQTQRKKPTDLLTVGEVAERAGIPTSAVRYYESEGLIQSTRTSGNQRRYKRHVLRRLGIILAARRFGISLSEVAEVLDTLPDNRMPGKRDWQRIAAAWQERLAGRRREIERLETELTRCIGCGCLSLKTCTLFNPGDDLASEGPGPRRVFSAHSGD